MCLTTPAMMLFLSLLNPEIIDLGADTVTIHAEVDDVIWTVRAGDEWCHGVADLAQTGSGRGEDADRKL